MQINPSPNLHGFINLLLIILMLLIRQALVIVQFQCIQTIDIFRYSSNLLLTTKDKAVFRASCLKSALTQCIYNIQNATNHDMVTTAIHRLHMYVTIGQKDSIVDKLLGTDWIDALHR